MDEWVACLSPRSEATSQAVDEMYTRRQNQTNVFYCDYRNMAPITPLMTAPPSLEAFPPSSSLPYKSMKRPNYVPNEAPRLSTCSMNGPLPMSPQAPLPPMENTYFKNNPTDPSSYPFVYGSMNNYSYPLYNSSTPTGGMFLLELLMNRGSQCVPVPMYMWERGFGVSGWSIADSMFELQVFLPCSMWECSRSHEFACELCVFVLSSILLIVGQHVVES